eukprot:jgi/Chlat1/8513/Chrsp80S07898
MSTMERFEKIKSLGRGAQGTVILVRALSVLKHPNIVGYYGSFEEDGVLNVVMEYADGGSLFQHIQKAKAPFPESEILDWLAQLLLALKHMHEKKILHRDLKTKNVFLTKKLRIKLGDFGLSKVLGTASSFAQSAVGTPYYLSPELCEGRPYNGKSDVWALGCVTYELTTFRHAFDATNLPALAQPAPVPSTYSPELRDLVRRMLSKDPDARPEIDRMLMMPLLQPYVHRHAAEAREAIRGPLAGPKPFFEAGSVETPLSKAMQQDAAKHKEAPAASHVLSELEEEQQFERLIYRMRHALKVTDRRASDHGRGVPHFACFPGSQLVSYLATTLHLNDREDAVAAAQRWLDGGVFYHVVRNGERFIDSPSALYRFKEDEVGSILNMKAVWNGPNRSAAHIEADFRKALRAIFPAYTLESGRLVDYEGLALSEAFRDYAAAATELQGMRLGELAFTEKITLFINMYNALVVHGFVVVGPPTGLFQRLHFYSHTCYNVGGRTYALNEVQHGILRGNQKPHGAYRRVFQPHDSRLADAGARCGIVAYIALRSLSQRVTDTLMCAVVVWDPRIHFALVSGTRSCPALRVYEPDHLETMLDVATSEYCTRHVQVSAVPDQSGKHVVQLPAIFEWYHEDFATTDALLLIWIAERLPSERKSELRSLVERDKVTINYIPHDWSLNKATKSKGATAQSPPSSLLAPKPVADTCNG